MRRRMKNCQICHNERFVFDANLGRRVPCQCCSPVLGWIYDLASTKPEIRVSMRFAEEYTGEDNYDEDSDAYAWNRDTLI